MIVKQIWLHVDFFQGLPKWVRSCRYQHQNGAIDRSPVSAVQCVVNVTKIYSNASINVILVKRCYGKM